MGSYKNEDPQNTQYANTTASHQHRNDHVAHTTQGTGQYFDEDKECIGWCDNVDDLHADFDNFLV